MQPKLKEHTRMVLSSLENIELPDIGVQVDYETDQFIYLLSSQKLENIYQSGKYRVKLSFNSGEAMYRGTANLIVEDHEADLTYSLMKPIVWRRIQQREYYRFDIHSDVEGCTNKQNRWLKFISEDLSGSGILIKGDEKLNINDELLLKSDLFGGAGNNKLIPARVKRIFKQDDQVFAGLEFVPSLKQDNLVANINPNIAPYQIEYYSDRLADKLASFVLKKQLEKNRKNSTVLCI